MAKMVIHTPDEAPMLDWPNAMVLGLDPSMTSTGWSIISFSPGRYPEVKGHGWFGTEPTGIGKNMQDNLIRMGQLYEMGCRIMRGAENYGCDFVAIELPTPHGQGASSQSGSMACTAMAIATQSYRWIRKSDSYHIPIAYIHPTHSKKVVTGNGKASKAEMKDAVKGWVDYPNWHAKQDITDSAGAALTAVLDIVEGRLTDAEILEELR